MDFAYSSQITERFFETQALSTKTEFSFFIHSAAVFTASHRVK
nr:MAG TPA: hypothetical protein [Caudoviricetes sp.]